MISETDGQDSSTLTHENLFSYLAQFARGRANAVNSSELQSYFECSGRRIRTLIPEIEEKYNVVVMSSYDSRAGGYYLPESRGELEDGLRELKSHAIAEITHFNRKLKTGIKMFGVDPQLFPLPEEG